jgi:hypothetical protein
VLDADFEVEKAMVRARGSERKWLQGISTFGEHLKKYVFQK